MAELIEAAPPRTSGTRGVVWDGELSIRDGLRWRPLTSRDVLVRVTHAGVCHSDLSVVNGTIPIGATTVLGHEGAGVVEAVGPAVRNLAPGDHIVIVPFGSCGQCAACEVGAPSQCRNPDGGGTGAGRMSIDGADVAQFANIGAWAGRTVLFETQCVKIDPAVPLSVACLLSCALLTGFGAVVNRAQVRPGATVAVLGVGGIGQAVIQAARLSAVARIIAVDLNTSKRSIAAEMGATDFVDVGAADLPDAIRAIVPGGVDYVFECVGIPALVRAGFESLAAGGTEVMLGVAPANSDVALPAGSFYLNRSVLGCRMGAARPHYDIPMLADLYRQGRLLLDEMVTKIYPIDEVSAALDDLAAGRLNRGVLTFEGWEES